MPVPAIATARTVAGAGAACSGTAGQRADFFSTDAVDVAAARTLCSRCPVQLRCLAGALARDEQWGVWGGWLFEPLIVRTHVLPVSAFSGGQSGAVGGAAGWVVWVTDRWNDHRVQGRFETRAAAVDAAERWKRESRGRALIGRRLARVLRGLVPDAELYRPPGDAQLIERAINGLMSDFESAPLPVQPEIPFDHDWAA